MNYQFIYLPEFDRRMSGLLTDDDIQAIENQLNRDPRAGDVIPNAGGVRKLRIALPGRGKRGGGRVIYLYIEIEGRIYLITLYAKSVQENISAAQKKEIRVLAAMLKGEQS